MKYVLDFLKTASARWYVIMLVCGLVCVVVWKWVSLPDTWLVVSLWVCVAAAVLLFMAGVDFAVLPRRLRRDILPHLSLEERRTLLYAVRTGKDTVKIKDSYTADALRNKGLVILVSTGTLRTGLYRVPSRMLHLLSGPAFRPLLATTDAQAGYESWVREFERPETMFA